MKVGKPKSKRQPVRLRNKIQKASAAKKRKDKKLEKKNPQWRSRLKKDPGIPNLFPYKEKLLHDIEENKRMKEEEVIRKKEEAKAARGEVTGRIGDNNMVDEDEDDDALLDYEGYSDEDDAMDEDGDDANPMAALLASARARASDFDKDNVELDEDDFDEDSEDDEAEGFVINNDARSKNRTSRRDTSRHAFDKAFKEVISAADVVLYVLDARDPIGTRSRDTEIEITKSPDKRIILVLNKIDLIPPSVLKNWLTHLRRSYPTIPLRAATSAAPNAKTFDHKSLTPANTANILLKALKNWAGSRQLKRAVNVGIIGYPNVGKSSVINALTSRLGGRAATCPTGAEAGVTTSMREVKLDSKIKLLDSPGIVFPSKATEKEGKGTASSSKVTGSKRATSEQARLVLLNAVPPKEITDPSPAVTLLLERLSETPDLYAKLLDTYNIPPLGSKDRTNEFLLHVARSRGRLGKGGVPNMHSAAMTVVTDWREGRIQGWVEPPKVEFNAANGSNDQRKIVTQWAEEFKLDGLWGDAPGDEKAGDVDIMQE